MTSTFELDPWMNQPATYLGQRRSLSSKVIVRTHRQTHTQDGFLYVDH